MTYVPLNVHSQFSILDSTASVVALAEKAKASGCPALAITDEGNLYGVVEFYKACKAAGVKPIIGIATVEVSHKKAAATANGFASCVAYLGAAVAGGPLGAVIKEWGWDSYLLTLFGCGVMCVVLMIPLWSVKTNPKAAEAEAAS
jgi:sugar phosphate permease